MTETIRAAAPPSDGALPAVVARLAGLQGWKRLAAAGAAGGLATLALPPAHVLPLLWIAFPALLWLLRGSDGTRRPSWTAFWTGWWFGFVHFTLGLYWISVALWVDIGRFWWAVPLAVGGLPALLSVFVGAAAAAHTWARRRLRLTGAAEALTFAVLWTLAEWLRGHLFTGFPWNLIGYGWTAVQPVLQTTALVGIYGLGLLTVAVAALPVVLAQGGGAYHRWRGVRVIGAGLAVLAGVAVAGAVRMQGTEGLTVPGVQLRIVQAHIPQSLKWQPEVRAQNLQRHIDLSLSPGWTHVTHIVWPETAVPYFPERAPWVLGLLAEVAPENGFLLTGVPRLDMDAGRPVVTNSLIAVDPAGRIAASYDKFHLVPFGEYLPFRRFLPQSLSAIASVGLDTMAGPGPRTVGLPGLPPFAPQICYEAIFPGNVAPDPTAGEVRPGWLLNATNDAWYGNTAGPHQHFAIAQVRAVEEGLPLVRAANTGISGVVDAYGRVTASLPLGETGVLDAPLPVASEMPTPYARFGDMLLVMLLFGVAALTLVIARRSRA